MLDLVRQRVAGAEVETREMPAARAGGKRATHRPKRSLLSHRRDDDAPALEWRAPEFSGRFELGVLQAEKFEL